MDTRGNDFFLGKHASPEYLRQLAREFRANPTPAERALWGHIRDRRLAGLRFRRQHIMGRFIVDFFAYLHDHPWRGLVVELDGRSHRRTAEYDTLRDEWMKAQAYHVLRFPNEAAHNDITSILTTITSFVRL